MKKILITTIAISSVLAFAGAESYNTGDKKMVRAMPAMMMASGTPEGMPRTGDAVIDGKIATLVKEREDKIKAIRQEYEAKIKAVIGDKKVLLKEMTGERRDDWKATGTRPMGDRPEFASGTRPMGERMMNGSGTPGMPRRPEVRGASTEGMGFIERFFSAFRKSDN